MASRVRTSYVAECFWPGVREGDLHEVDQRVRGAVADAGGEVRYLGWQLVIDDEVVWLEFDGPIATVRRLAELARIPFGRILRVTRGPTVTYPAEIDTARYPDSDSEEDP
jgi:hypothetical protein